MPKPWPPVEYTCSSAATPAFFKSRYRLTPIAELSLSSWAWTKNAGGVIFVDLHGFRATNGAPVDLMAGAARISGDEAKSPHLEIRNKELKAIRHLEIGLALKDTNEQEFFAATVPCDETLARKGTAALRDSATLRVRNTGGSRLVLDSMAGLAGAGGRVTEVTSSFFDNFASECV
ncbi:MAG: hypothetical protein ACKV2U_20655 [Bryobacteraceae bacterium]